MDLNYHTNWIWRWRFCIRWNKNDPYETRFPESGENILITFKLPFYNLNELFTDENNLKSVNKFMDIISTCFYWFTKYGWNKFWYIK